MTATITQLPSAAMLPVVKVHNGGATTYRDALRRAIEHAVYDAVGGSPWAPDLEEEFAALMTVVQRQIDGSPVLAELFNQFERRGGDDDFGIPF